MAKKLKFGEDGQVAETIEGIEPEMKSLVKKNAPLQALKFLQEKMRHFKPSSLKQKK
jgi:hypothetical protein